MRDIRKKDWFWLDNTLVDREDIGAMEKLIYMVLARFSDQNGKCFPSQEKLCKISGVKDYRTIVKYIEALEKKGLVEVEKRIGKSNIYYLKNVNKIEKQENEENLDVPHSEAPTSNVGTSNVGTSNVGTPPTSNVGTPPTSNVGRTIHKEQNTINNTQLKEKNKKEKTGQTEKLLNYIETLEINSEKKKIFKEWVEYKKNKGQYKDTKSLDILIRRFIKYSVEELRDIVENSIMNNYAGIFEKKGVLKNGNNNYKKISNIENERNTAGYEAEYPNGEW